jgi:hypothetical protein
MGKSQSLAGISQARHSILASITRWHVHTMMHTMSNIHAIAVGV